MNCKELHKSILKYFEKELTPEKENEFKEHIVECNGCAGLYADITETYMSLNTEKEIEPKAFFTESVMIKIEAVDEKGKENILDITLDIAISRFFKKFAYTGVAFIIALFILLYTTDNLSLFNNVADDDDFSTDNVSTVFFENL
jgi:hypothetical protein